VAKSALSEQHSTLPSIMPYHLEKCSTTGLWVPAIVLHIWASAELMHNLLKMMVVPDSAGDAS
jgi:hypothetical protein